MCPAIATLANQHAQIDGFHVPHDGIEFGSINEREAELCGDLGGTGWHQVLLRAAFSPNGHEHKLFGRRSFCFCFPLCAVLCLPAVTSLCLACDSRAARIAP